MVSSNRIPESGGEGISSGWITIAKFKIYQHKHFNLINWLVLAHFKRPERSQRCQSHTITYVEFMVKTSFKNFNLDQTIL